MRTIALTMALLSSSAPAEDFDARQKAGEAALADKKGQQYVATWGAAMQTSLPTCIPVGSTSPENLGTFTFVANVDATGTVSAIEVQPSTAVSRCFAEKFSRAQLPPPPSPLPPGGFFPIADVVEVVP